MAIAEALAAARSLVAEGWPPTGGYATDARDTHDRKLIHFAKLEAIDAIASVVAGVLDDKSASFDRARFFRVVSGR